MFRDHRVAGEWLPKTMYITRFQESGFKSLAHVRRGRRRHDRLDPGVTISGDSLAHVEGERAQPAQRNRRSAQHQRRDARLEQPHSRRRHDEARQAGVVHDHAEPTRSSRRSASGASRRSICRSRRRTPSQVRARRRATRRKRRTARKRMTRNRPPRSPTRNRQRTRRRSISPSRSSMPQVTRRDSRSRAMACHAVRSRFTSSAAPTRRSSASRRSSRWCCRRTCCPWQISCRPRRDSIRRSFDRSDWCSIVLWPARSSSMILVCRRARRRSWPSRRRNSAAVSGTKREDPRARHGEGSGAAIGAAARLLEATRAVDRVGFGGRLTTRAPTSTIGAD